MSDAMYLTLMLGSLAIIIAILVPTMFFTRCRNCGAFNGLDCERCRKCDRVLPK
mgnify:CR=1 FL=1